MVADGVDEQREAAESDAFQDLHHEFDDFGIDHGRFRPDGLGADLVELAVAALLRPLAPEHRTDVVQLLQSRLLIQPVLDIGANHGCSSFRPQSERAAVTVLKGVHFFADDVGVLADATGEQRGFFQDRRADLLVVVRPEDFARDRFYLVPGGAGGRQDIARAFDRFDHRIGCLCEGSGAIQAGSSL